MTTLYLIRGVPGSGKSTFAKILYNNDIVADYFEADELFVKDGEYKFDATKLGMAHSRCQSLCKQVLSEGYSVAVSNTSTTEKEVAIYQKIAEDCGAKFVSIIVESRHSGTNVHGVPEDKIQQMKNRFSVKL